MTKQEPQRIELQDKINDAVKAAMQHPENFITAFLHQNPDAKIEDFTLCQQNTLDGIKFWIEPRAAMQPAPSEALRELWLYPGQPKGTFPTTKSAAESIYAFMTEAAPRHKITVEDRKREIERIIEKHWEALATPSPAPVSIDAREIAHRIVYGLPYRDYGDSFDPSEAEKAACIIDAALRQAEREERALALSEAASCIHEGMLVAQAKKAILNLGSTPTTEES